MSADVCRARPFTVGGYVSLLKEAVRVLRSAHEYEEAVDIYKLMLPVFESTESFSERADAHGAVADLCDLIVAEEAAGSRLWPIFYLVEFIGDAFKVDQLACTRFIYREPGSVCSYFFHLFLYYVLCIMYYCFYSTHSLLDPFVLPS